MRKKLLTILFSFLLLSSFAQLDGECFIEVKKQHLKETKSFDFANKYETTGLLHKELMTYLN